MSEYQEWKDYKKIKIVVREKRNDNWDTLSYRPNISLELLKYLSKMFRTENITLSIGMSHIPPRNIVTVINIEDADFYNILGDGSALREDKKDQISMIDLDDLE